VGVRNSEVEQVYQQGDGKDCKAIWVGNMVAAQEDTPKCLSRDSQPLVSSLTLHTLCCCPHPSIQVSFFPSRFLIQLFQIEKLVRRHDYT